MVGNIQGAYTKLLEEPYIAAEKKEEERIMTAVELCVAFGDGGVPVHWL
ncbi:hypothetical protein [Paenibacillus sp. UMB4589-SE434]|nr:hypothetical protein [Paenibacillus sp. UMB4589-SE434]MDK8183360.1 hypothetical protein [Paenibacillus sp. UMB4589-SE434]